MNEEELGRRLAGVLTTCDVDGPAAQRLRTAREAALAAHGGLSAPRHASSWRGVALRMALAAAAVALVFVALGEDGGMVGDRDGEELDAALLADDLPIDAYLDQDFKTWLEQG